VTGPRAILLPVGDDLFAVAVDLVREVVVAPRITPVPTAPSSVLGVFNLRGAVVPIMDTGRLLDREALTGIACALVVRCEADDVALVASAIPTVVDLTTPVQTSDSVGGLGTYAVDEALVTLIDPEALVTQAGPDAEPSAVG
jgi:purine-binding chemotaxis protein CheW